MILASLRAMQAPPRSLRASLMQGVGFAAQAIVCAVILRQIYEWAGLQGVGWAIVSAVLCLMPDLKQSWSMATVRVVANLIGAMVGFLVGAKYGLDFWHMMAAMALTAVICQLLRLDQGVRTACVSVIIVMTTHLDVSGGAGGSLSSVVATTSRERLVAVFAGCGLSLMVQAVLHLTLAAMHRTTNNSGTVQLAAPTQVAHHDG